MLLRWLGSASPCDLEQHRAEEVLILGEVGALLVVLDLLYDAGEEGEGMEVGDYLVVLGAIPEEGDKEELRVGLQVGTVEREELGEARGAYGHAEGLVAHLLVRDDDQEVDGLAVRVELEF